MSHRIRCTLENASENISGITFRRDGDAMIGETEDAEVAGNFSRIPGYEVVQVDADGQVDAGSQVAAGGKKSNGRAINQIVDQPVTTTTE